MGTILFAQIDDVQVLKFVGDVRVTLGPTISDYLESVGQDNRLKAIVIDLTETICIDSTSLGLLAKISLRSQDVLKVLPTIISSNEDVTRILTSMGFERIFLIVGEMDICCEEMGVLPETVANEAELREQVLEAHRILMKLSKSNELKFKNLVEALELERSEAASRDEDGLVVDSNRKLPRYALGRR